MTELANFDLLISLERNNKGYLITEEKSLMERIAAWLCEEEGVNAVVCKKNKNK